MDNDTTVGKLLDSSFGDLRQDIRDMRKEQREDIRALTEKVDDGFATMTQRATKIATDLADHELADVKTSGEVNSRLTSLESLRNNLKWFTRTAIGAFIVFLFDLAVNHVPHWFK